MRALALPPPSGGDDMKGVRNSEFLATCKACGQSVREDHSHVMVVPVGRGRMFFHARCWRVRAVRELAADGPKVRVEESSA